MRRLIQIAAALSLAFSCARQPDFNVFTVPPSDALAADCSLSREGNEWTIGVSVRNDGSDTAVFRLGLAAEPHFRAEQYLFPGINYNGNPFGENMPQGWEHDGQPWIFAYDRGSIPSCTVSENSRRVFALFASDADTASFVSSSSMEKLDDGSFRHLIYWPVVEAPLSYTDKKKFSGPYETFLTLAPGEEFHACAFACEGKPRWRHFGFAEVFPVAWKRLRHDVPSRRSVAEVARLDKAFQDWCRRQDDRGYWYGGIIDDKVFRAGYYSSGRSDDGYTVADYDAHPELNRWDTDEVEQSKHLKPGEYVRGPGRDLGFAAQSFQMARLSVQNGLENDVQEDVDFGLKVFRSWIRGRQAESGMFRGYKPGDTLRCDASRAGWAVSELARLVKLLEEHGMDASEFRSSASRLIDTILSQVGSDGNPASCWDTRTGEILSRGGDGGGYVLMGLARWMQLLGDRSLLPVLEKAMDYYYAKDINYFRCAGGAMDCVSVDREGIHPFLTTALILYRVTGKEKYLDYARKAGWYFLSWLYLQNPVYGPETDLYKLAWRPAGATIVGAEHPALDEYACVLIPEFFELSRLDGEPLWKEVAALVWRNSTQGFADEGHRVFHGLERPIGSKNEAIFPSRWSKYAIGEKKRGSINDHLTAWGGTYRLASLLELSDADRAWLDEKPYDVYLLIGQSNMAGRGELLPEDSEPVPGVYLLDDKGNVVPAVSPFNRYSTIRKRLSMQGYCFGASFAEALHASSGRPVLLVMNARGGSDLKQWEKGAGGLVFSKKEGDEKSLWGGVMPSFYEEAVRRARQAMDYGDLKAILWHQGEGDSEPEKAALYPEKFAGFVRDLRSELGDVPVIMGEVNHSFKRSALINPVLREVAGQIGNCTCISAEGCAAKDDSLHFNRAGCILLGQRYAEALKNIFVIVQIRL